MVIYICTFVKGPHDLILPPLTVSDHRHYIPITSLHATPNNRPVQSKSEQKNFSIADGDWREVMPELSPPHWLAWEYSSLSVDLVKKLRLTTLPLPWVLFRSEERNGEVFRKHVH